jgi:hypothetical protein
MITSTLERDHLKFEHGNAFPQDSSVTGETENLSLHFMNRFHKYLTSKCDVQSK